jgi:hypothetical protein
VQTMSAQMRTGWFDEVLQSVAATLRERSMSELEWTAVVLPNALDAGHGDMHAQIAIDRRRHEVILKSDGYDPLAVSNFLNGPLLADYDARVFDVREDGGVHTVANYTLSIFLAGTLFPVSFSTLANGSVSSRLENPSVERQRRCDESRLGVMQALRNEGYHAALLGDCLDERSQTGLQVLVDYKAPDFSSVFELADLAETGAYFDVPVEIVPLKGILKAEHTEQLLRQGFMTLSDDGTRLESFDGSPDEVERWIQRPVTTP